MTFRQAYYTSCKQGLRGGKGFQINAASEGIDPSVLQQVERLGLYVPPVSAPSRPTPGEIERFPVSLIFQRLPGGEAVIAQAKYTGADYSGRFGNYFTHSLIFSEPEQLLKEAGLLPVELWGGKLWTTTESPITALPPVVRIESGPVVEPARVMEFLNSGNRLRQLPAFLMAVEGALASGRRIVMVDHSQAVALWISAASYVLPRHLALKLTFNTYVKNPYQNDFLVVGTTSDSDFGFAPHEIDHQFYVFDFEGDRFTRFAETTPFAQMVTTAYNSGRLQEIIDFPRVVERIAPNLEVEDLDAAFAFHTRHAKVEAPGVNAGRVMSWCAKVINGFETQELEELRAAVAANDAPQSDLVAAYTDLYLAALAPSIRPDLREVIELPYLDWLIRIAPTAAPLNAFSRAAERLRVEPSIKSEAAPLVLSWIKQVRQCSDLSQLQPLFEVADKLGFLETREEALHLIGEELFGPSLPVPSVRDVFLRYADRPGMRSIIEGMGAYFASNVGRPEPFSRLSEVLANYEIYKSLARQALEQQSLALYFRLVGARLPQVLDHPTQRIDAFNDCVAGIKMMMSDMPGEHLDNAFTAVWKDTLPTLEEATALLDLLEKLDVKDSTIPRRIVDLVATCDVTALDRQQQDLLRRLSARHSIYQTLGKKQAVIDAYRIPAELESSGDALAEEINASLDFLEQSPQLGDELMNGIYSIIARYMVQVKDVEQHAALLIRAFKYAGGRRFLHTYDRFFVEALETPSKTRAKVAARLVCIGISVGELGGRVIAANIFDSLLPRTAARWNSKELKKIDDELAGDNQALQNWARSLEIAARENTSAGRGGWTKYLGFSRRRPEKG